MSSLSSTTSPTEKEVGLMPGDSGGPVLVDGVIYGVAHGALVRNGKWSSSYAVTGNPLFVQYLQTIHDGNPQVSFVPSY